MGSVKQTRQRDNARKLSRQDAPGKNRLVMTIAAVDGLIAALCLYVAAFLLFVANPDVTMLASVDPVSIGRINISLDDPLILRGLKTYYAPILVRRVMRVELTSPAFQEETVPAWVRSIEIEVAEPPPTASDAPVPTELANEIQETEQQIAVTEAKLAELERKGE